MRRERQGFLLCALASAGFGAMAILAKLAYDAGVGAVELLAIRFAIAAAVLGLLARHRDGVRPHGRPLLAGLALGGVLYATEAGLFFASLKRLDASVAELLLYAYPGLVVLGAIALRRERASRRRFLALALGTGGVALVLLGGRSASIEPVGAALALGAAVSYAVYILAADTVSRRVAPLVLATLVCCGAALTFTVAGLATGSIDLAFGWQGWLAVVALALVCTVLPISTFLAGMERIGPGRASIVSTLEPAVTLFLAWLVFSERLAPGQLLGALLVLTAVLVLQARGLRSRRRADPAAPSAPRPAPAGEVGEVAPVGAGVGV